MADRREIEVKITGNARELKNATSQANKSLDTLGGTAKKIGGVLAGAFAVGAITNYAKEAVKAAAVSQGVERAFKRLGITLESLRQATRGTVDDFKLMQAAVQARNLGVPVEQLARLFEFAQKRASETGESVDYLVQSIVTGIGRKSVLILDNLGLSSIRINEEFKKMGDFGAAVGKIVDEELGGMGETSLTTADRIAQLNASLENLQGQIGQLITYAIEPLIESLNQLFPEQQDPLAEWFQSGELQQQVFLLGEQLTQLKKKHGENSEVVKEATSFYLQMYNALAELVPKFEQKKEKVEEATDVVDIHSEALDVIAKRLHAEALATEVARIEWEKYLETASKIKPIVGFIGFSPSELVDTFIPNPDDVKSRMQVLENILKEYSEKRKKRKEEEKQFEANIDKELKDEKIAIAVAGLAAASNIATALTSMQRSKMNEELKAAGDNEKKKEEIRRKYAKKDQAIAILQSIINTALGVTSALATANVPLAIAIGAAGAIQTGVIASQQFARGTSFFGEGGMALVGERGPEVVNLPRGASVTPNHLIGSGGGTVINVSGFVGNEYELARQINIVLANQGNNVARTTF